MARIGDGHAALTFFSIQGEGVGSQIFNPESLLKAILEGTGLKQQVVSQCDQTLFAGQIGGAFFGGIGIALDFTERDRGFGKPAVLVKDGIVRIFPALLHEPFAGMTGILQEAVAVAIAIMIHPIEGALDIAPNRTDEFEVSGAFVVGGSEHDEEGSGIYAAVVTAKGDFLGGGHLAFAQFVKNFSGF